MNIPVIFVTAKIEMEDEKRGLELGRRLTISPSRSARPLSCASEEPSRPQSHGPTSCADQNDWDTAERLAFTLKGVSGKVSVNWPCKTVCGQARCCDQGTPCSQAAMMRPTGLDITA